MAEAAGVREAGVAAPCSSSVRGWFQDSVGIYDSVGFHGRVGCGKWVAGGPRRVQAGSCRIVVL